MFKNTTDIRLVTNNNNILENMVNLIENGKYIKSNHGFYDYNDKDKFVTKYEIHFKQYYPQMNYDVCKKILCNRCKITGNTIEFTFGLQKESIEIKTQIMVGNNMDTETYKYFNIVKMQKIIGNKIINVDTIYTECDICNYVITVDLPIDENCNNFYAVDNECFDVTFDNDV